VTVSVTGGTGPYTASLSAGAFPPGLAFSGCTGFTSGCVISGTPTSVGNYNITIKVVDSGSGLVSSGNLPISVQSATNPLTVTVGVCSDGTVGLTYPGCPLTAVGGTPPYTWGIAAGALPPGTAIVGSNISGIPTTIGTYNFTPRVVDSASNSATDATPPSIFVGTQAGVSLSSGTVTKGVSPH